VAAPRPAVCAASAQLPVRPRDVNIYGSVFGGFVIEQADRLAALAASRFASRPVVTASLDLITFVAGIRAYQQIALTARATRVFRTSMEVLVAVEGVDPVGGTRWKTSDAGLTLVCMGEDGRPAPFPALSPGTPEERVAWDAAEQRRALRLVAPEQDAAAFPPAAGAAAERLSLQTSTEICFPGSVNEMGAATAGWLMSLADRLAGVAASTHARRPAVTASVDGVRFRRPVHLGEVVVAHAYLTRAFRTSCEVRVDIWKRGPLAGPPAHVTTAYFTYVALGEDGRPTPVPPLAPRTSEERRRHEAAGVRRELRQRALGLAQPAR
jgi:acyl-CoA hydrolase